MGLLKERFERWLAGLPADLHDPTLRKVTIDGATIYHATLDSPTFIGIPTAPANPFGIGSDQVATTQGVVLASQAILFLFVPVLQTSGQVVAGTIASTYLLGTQSQVLVVGGNSLIPPQTTFIQASDIPPFAGSTPKFRLRFQLCTNSTAPTGDFTVGLYPIMGTSGAAGGITYSVGAVVPGSTATVTALGANANVSATSLEFPIPADGFYSLGLVTTATTAASSHTHICAQLRRNYSSP